MDWDLTRYCPWSECQVTNFFPGHAKCGETLGTESKSFFLALEWTVCNQESTAYLILKKSKHSRQNLLEAPYRTEGLRAQDPLRGSQSFLRAAENLD